MPHFFAPTILSQVAGVLIRHWATEKESESLRPRAQRIWPTLVAVGSEAPLAGTTFGSSVPRRIALGLFSPATSNDPAAAGPCHCTSYGGRGARSALHALSRPSGSPGRTPWFGMRFRATARDGPARSGSSVFASWREAPAARGRMTFAASECGDRARVAGRLSYGKSAFDPPRGAFFICLHPSPRR